MNIIRSKGGFSYPGQFLSTERLCAIIKNNILGLWLCKMDTLNEKNDLTRYRESWENYTSYD